MLDIREVLLDGLEQMNSEMLMVLNDVSTEQMNWLPAGKSVSIGFNAWHVLRTQDNIANFVMQRKQPVWIEQGFFERMNLPKVDQGTGMTMEDARKLVIPDRQVLLDYAAASAKSCMEYVKVMPAEVMEEIQPIKPLGEMPKWKVFRRVIMTHGFTHIGEINGHKGQLGLSIGI